MGVPHERFSVLDPSYGFGLVTHELRFDPDALPVRDPAQVLALRRLSVIQCAFLADTVLTAGGLEAVPFPERDDVILNEALPLLKEELEPAEYRLNSRAVSGVVVPYRGIHFLLSTFSIVARLDFACWRLPDAPTGAAWPDIIGPLDVFL